MKPSEVFAAVRFAVEALAPDTSVVAASTFAVIDRASHRDMAQVGARSVVVSLDQLPTATREFSRKVARVVLRVSVVYPTGEGDSAELDGAIADDASMLREQLEALRETGAEAPNPEIASVDVTPEDIYAAGGAIVAAYLVAVTYQES